MIDEYTFSSKEMLHQKVSRMFHAKRQPVVGFRGRFTDFKDASEVCGGGYENGVIFEKVKKATLEVKEGKAAYERDGFLFYEKEYYLQLLEVLYEVFFEYGECDVIDIGGSLGSTYFQNRDKLLKYIAQIKWNIVEQRHYVKWGKKNLEDEYLKFYYSMDEVDKCNVALFGGSLQYLEDYHIFLEQVAARGIKHLIIDRLTISNEAWVSVEYAHEPIYEASYPVHVISEKELISEMNLLSYQLVMTWIKDVGEVWQVDNKLIKCKSYVFEKQEM